MIVKQLNDDWVEVGNMTIKISAITAVMKPYENMNNFGCKIGSYFHTIYEVTHEEAMQAYDDVLAICIASGMGRCV